MVTETDIVEYLLNEVPVNVVKNWKPQVCNYNYFIVRLTIYIVIQVIKIGYPIGKPNSNSQITINSVTLTIINCINFKLI